MPRITKRMPSPEGVSAGSTATIKFPIGNRFHTVWLQYGSMALASMTEIRVLLNSKVIQRFSGEERDRMNRFRGVEAANGILEIPFDRRDLLTRSGQEETAINTGSRSENGEQITSFNIEVDIAEDATNVELRPYAEISDRTSGGPGTVMHIKKNTRSAAGEGEFEVSDLPYGGKTTQALNAVFIRPRGGTGDISRLKVQRGLYDVFERTKNLNEWIQRNSYRNPQTGYQVIDFTENRFGGNVLNLVGYSDFRYLFDMTADAELVMLSEYVGELGD